MHILLNISPNFYRFSPLIMRRLSALQPETRISALAHGGKTICDGFKERLAGLNVEDVHNCSDLEESWLKKPYQSGALRKYEKILGANAVNRIVLADRLVGYGYIRGGKVAQTPLSHHCATDEMRHRYLSGLLDFLFNWFKKNPPDVILTYGVAGTFTLAVSLLAEHFNIEFRRINSIRLMDRNILDPSYLNLGGPLKQLYEQALQDESLVVETRQEARTLLQKARENPQAPDYHMAVRKNVLKLPPLVDLAALVWRFISRRPPESLANPYFLSRLFWEFRRWTLAHWLLRFKRFDTREEFKGRKFVYFPLQFDPEAATMVLAPHATNQLLVLELLSKAIPAEWTLVVKDHYTMLGRRPVSFYKDLKSIPKVRILPATVSSFDLIRESELVVTVTGTAAWEAMLMGEPALMLGPTHFQNVGEGFVYEKNISALAEAVERALETPPATDRALEIYLATMLKSSFSMPGSILVDVALPDSFLEAQTNAIEAIAQGLASIEQPVPAAS
jgi:hypothetical protein